MKSQRSASATLFILQERADPLLEQRKRSVLEPLKESRNEGRRSLRVDQLVEQKRLKMIISWDIEKGNRWSKRMTTMFAGDSHAVMRGPLLLSDHEIYLDDNDHMDKLTSEERCYVERV